MYGTEIAPPTGQSGCDAADFHQARNDPRTTYSNMWSCIGTVPSQSRGTETFSCAIPARETEGGSHMIHGIGVPL